MNSMQIFSHTNMDSLAGKFIEDILSPDNFKQEHFSKGSFLTGGSVIVCESKGLQEYLQKKCAEDRGIWTSIPFKPLAGLLMQCAFNLSNNKNDEKYNIFNDNNLRWAIYKSLKPEEQKFSFACEISSLFSAYQIYRPEEIIGKWNRGGEAFTNNEEWQKELWLKVKKENPNEKDIAELYKDIEIILQNPKAEKKYLPKRIFIFAPLSIAPVHIKTLKLLAESGCKVNLYLFQISNEYIGEHKSDKQIANLRKKAWENNKIIDEQYLYWNLGNRLIANLGRSAQVLYEQIDWENLNYENSFPSPRGVAGTQSPDGEYGSDKKDETLLAKMQTAIISDDNEKIKCEYDNSLSFNSCFSPLREVEVLYDYILSLIEIEKYCVSDIAVVAPDMEIYASAIETVFNKHDIPYKIADKNIQKYDKSIQLLNLLFTQIDGVYEAESVVSLFEYSKYVQEKELSINERELLEKWIRENAIRHGLDGDYSFERGFEQLAAGFFMIAEFGLYNDENDYCYPDIEGNSAQILGDFAKFVGTLQKFDEASKIKQTISDWNAFFEENLPIIFGSDKNNFDDDSPYKKIINAWYSLLQEMQIGLGNEKNTRLDFSVIKNALLKKAESNAKSSYFLTGKISFSNIETMRAVPCKVICCLGMNTKEFPKIIYPKEISLLAEYKHGDKDSANEERLMFLEIILSAQEKLYISWIGQSDDTAEELEPSGAVVVLLENLKEQFGLEQSILVKKHPLQPFSRKYFDGTFETYDDRWDYSEGFKTGRSVWDWKVNSPEREEKRDAENLYRILNNAPKYFLREVCNIELPEETNPLENIEPFVVEKGLDEWKLADLILENEKDENSAKTERDVKIAVLRGDLPSGKFANNFIKDKEMQVKQLKKLEDKTVKTFIEPSKDKGKYRLRHWLRHLEMNCEKETVSDMILFDESGEKPVRIRLEAVESGEAKKELKRLWGLADGLRFNFLPLFPDIAWKYCASGEDEAKKIRDAESGIFGDDSKIREYCSYAKMTLNNIKSFEDLDEKNKTRFKIYSEMLFGKYRGEAQNNETA